MRQETVALCTGEERAKVLTVGTGALPGGAAGSIPTICMHGTWGLSSAPR